MSAERLALYSYRLYVGVLASVLRAQVFMMILRLHIGATIRFWQVMRRSQSDGARESVAAAAHLMLTRAVRNAPAFTIKTYDADQLTTSLSFSPTPEQPQ